ncbi:MAG TPA: hypothetical protein PLD05_14435 [Thermogutta sp.]|nr:hypothetical protein [Thermogutta sp.]
MRLTLRTLLAYLDNILDPEDAAELRRKIEESDVAKAVLRRIRELLRKERLGAPDVNDRQESLDPNTVAEYLDNTLPAERVADFEKVCLESDIELAEVAACHQILAMILGEPAEVDPKTREKMYRLPQTSALSEKPLEKIVKELVAEPPAEEAARAASTKPETGKTPPAEPVTFVSPTPHVRSWLLGLMVLLVVGAIGVGALALYKTLLPAPAGLPGGEVAQQTQPVKPHVDRGKSGVPDGGAPAKEPRGSVEGATPESPPGTPEAQQQTAPSTETAPTSSPPAPPKADAAEAVAQKPSEQPPKTPEDESMVPPMEESPAPPVAEQAPDALAAVTPQRGVPAPGEMLPSAPEIREVAPLPPEPIGRIVEDPKIPPILFRVHPDGALLHRVSLEEPLRTSEVFFVPPKYRTTIRLADSVDVLCVGPVFWELLPMDANGQLGIGITFGQMILTSRQADPTTLRLKCGNIEGRIEFGDAQSQVAIAVSRQPVCPGDPETQPVPWIVDMFSLGGTARWFDAEHPRPLVLRAPVQMRLSEAELAATPMTDQPEWIKPRVTTATILEERAMAVLEQALRDREKDPLLVLREQSANRQREVAWLAQRALAFAGEADVIWRVLEDLEYRPVWTEAVAVLRELVRISPRHAAAVRAAAEKTLGMSGTLAYTLLWKYPDTGITKSQAEELVQQLEHNNLAVRVVAFWTLRHITGMTLNYEPHSLPNDRTRAVQLWRERLTKGSVRGVADERPNL